MVDGKVCQVMDVFDDRACGLGEGPLWHPEREELFWVDIPAQKVMSNGLDGPREHRFDEMVSALGWIDRGTLLLASESGLYRLDIASWKTELVVPLEADKPANRSNDGRADPWGGFWIGTMGKHAEEGAGSFYRFFEGELRLQVPGITVTNGLCFDRSRGIGYCTDSAERKTWRLPLDNNGWLGAEPELFLDFSAEGTTIDGAIVDNDGHILVAIFDGAAVLRISPEGQVTDRFDTQTPRSTCPAFGGRDYTDLIVTTAAVGLEPTGADRIAHGSTLRFAGCVRGSPEPQVRL